ncbi:MAG TPA: hypothetical protein VG273_00115 [Bryobacteraceae bacterium]|jgi:hypothetical protein|nr:hypothetical protein [Bryobacteraceae bacterium]
MTPLSDFSAALHVAMGLFAVWILAFKFARDYRIDSLRDHLFALRDDLFDYAAEGNVEFDDPAYFKLRSLINSLIRFAHRLTFARFFTGVIFTSVSGSRGFDNPLLEWQSAVEALRTEQQKRLKEIHSAALVMVVRHLITGSPVMIVCLALFAVGAILNGLTKKLLLAFTEKLLPQLNSLQMQAIVADAAERQASHDHSAVLVH